jgi:hypothetical protein
VSGESKYGGPANPGAVYREDSGGVARFSAQIDQGHTQAEIEAL